ncbi:hypothetical protein ACTXT7_011357 [Hymenolepis weldensis]
MRDFVLKKANRAFLDIFWDISSAENSKRTAAIKKLDLQTSVTYTLDRLSKGLRSSPTPKSGCSIALISILKNNKNISKEAILTAFDKHVYSYKATDAKEKSITNRAKILCLYILAASNRLSDLDADDHRKIVTTLKPLLNTECCLLFMKDVLSQVIPEINSKFVGTYGDLISHLWDFAWQTKEPSASEVIFILRLQDCSEVMKLVKTKNRFDINDKSMIKRVVNAVTNCLPASEFERAAELISKFKDSCIFDKLWTRISAPIDKTDSPITQRIQILKVALELLSKLQTEEQFKIVLKLTLLAFLRKQLSTLKLSSHEDVCSLLNNLISELKCFPTTEDSCAKSENKDGSKIAVEKAMCLFRVIAEKMPFFDISVAPKAPHLLSSLLDIASTELSIEYLVNWSRDLQKMFLFAKEDSENSLTVDKQRLHILDLLRQIVFILTSRPSSSVDVEFLCESVDFFLLVANNNVMPMESTESKVTSAVSGSALTQLGRCLNLLIRRVPLKAEIREDSQHSKTCKQAMGTVDHCIKHLLETELKVCSENVGDEESENPLVHRLKVAEKMFKEDWSDSVGHWIGILYAITTIYALTLHTDPSTPKEISLLELLDDIFQAHRHRAPASDAMETDEEQQDSLEWSSVLTDAMLSLCVEPWRLLRDVVSATFGRMVARNEIYIQPTFDAPLEVVFGLKKAEKEEEEEMKPVSPLRLILSIADGKSKAAQERIGVAGEDDESDDEGDIDDEDECLHNDEEEDIGGFADMSDVKDLPEAEDEDINVEDDFDEEDEFLTNEQIEKEDEALTALFKANRASRIDTKTRKETIAVLKLRSFDFLENLLIYSSDAKLFLPTLHAVLQLAVLSYRKANRIQQKGTGDRGGYVPLARIVSTLENLRSRSAASNEALCKSISQSDEDLLPVCLKAIFTMFKNVNPTSLYNLKVIPDDRIIKCLQTTCDFLQFKKMADQKCSGALMKSLKEVLAEFLSKTHPSRTHQQLLIRLITSSPDMATSAKNTILQRLKSPTSESQSKSSSIYSETTLLSLANSVTTALATAKSSALSDWTIELSRALIGLFISTLSTNALMKSKAFAAAVFNSLFICFKSNKKVFDDLTADEIVTVLTVDRSEIPKATRASHSRLVQLMHTLRNSSKNLSSVLDELGSKRKQQKAEAKLERRQKRKAKALENAAKKKKARIEVDA